MTKTYNVFLTLHAQNDLEDIFSYIAADSPENAGAFVREIEEKILSLSTMPERCPLIPENVYFGTRLRHLIHKKYRVICRIRDDNVFVLRIIHGAKPLDF